MSYDALVWLLVGLGVGVAGSLMLLIGYAALERGRLGRRLRRARMATAAVATEPAKAVAVVPPKREASKSTPPAEKVVPVPKPVPVKPTLVAVSTAPATPAAPAPIASAEPVKSTTPVAVPAETPGKPALAPAPAAPMRPQSVEAMFAEAFANDKLTVSPEPDETARPPKP